MSGVLIKYCPTENSERFAESTGISTTSCKDYWD